MPNLSRGGSLGLPARRPRAGWRAQLGQVDAPAGGRGRGRLSGVLVVAGEGFAAALEEDGEPVSAGAIIVFRWGSASRPRA